MSTIVLYLTEAGLAELVHNESMSLGPVQLTAVHIGSAHWTPAPDGDGIVAVTALVTETKIFSAISGMVLDNNRVHITVRDTSTDTYGIGEIGIFTSTGTLFAVGSWGSDIITKGAGILLLSFDLVVSGNALTSLTVTDLGFSNPQATETLAGVAELATQTETNAGTDDQRMVTPLKLKVYVNQLQATESAVGVAEIATQIETNTGTDDQRMITPKKLKAILQMFVPTGLIQAFATLVAPAGYLVADGSLQSRTTYPDLLAALIKSTDVTINISSPSAADITWNAHPLQIGFPVKFKTTSSLPTGLLPNTTYYIVSKTTNTFKIALTPGGTPIITSGSQSGLHTAISAPFGDGDGSTTFGIPDMRGEFVRGWDFGRGIDINRIFGSFQAASAINNIPRDAPLYVDVINPDGTSNEAQITNYSQDSNYSNVHHSTTPIGQFVRPRNIALLVCIKY